MIPTQSHAVQSETGWNKLQNKLSPESTLPDLGEPPKFIMPQLTSI